MSEKRENGIVAVVKQGFGFIRCSEREQDVYFAFDEYQRADTPSNTELYVVYKIKKKFFFKKFILFFSFGLRPPPTPGVELEFFVATDRRTGKSSAVQLSLLPQVTFILIVFFKKNE